MSYVDIEDREWVEEEYKGGSIKYNNHMKEEVFTGESINDNEIDNRKMNTIEDFVASNQDLIIACFKQGLIMRFGTAGTDDFGSVSIEALDSIGRDIINLFSKGGYHVDGSYIKGRNSDNPKVMMYFARDNK